jgi:carboxypeptidase family protein
VHRLILRAAIAVVAFAVLAPLGAQAAPRHAIQGIAYDSVGNAPLANASVTLRGTDRTTTTDARGRFRIDSVAAGAYIVEVMHPELDSLGLFGIAGRAIVPGGDVTIATPSFATIWRAECGDSSVVPFDSGFVYGTVRAASTMAPVPGSNVTLTWIDLARLDERQVQQRQYRAIAPTDDEGTYGICGIPLGVTLRMQAGTDSLASGLIDVVGRKLQRRDLLLGGLPGRTSLFGVVVGMVSDTAGRPVANARAISDAGPETRTDADGRFHMRVPAGTQQLSVLALGMAPAAFVVDVAPNDTSLVFPKLQRVTTLAAVEVTARSTRGRYLLREFEERRRATLGYVRDSTTIGNRGTLGSAFFEVPSVTVRPGRGGTYLLYLPGRVRAGGDTGHCLANLWIDNFRADFEMLNFLRPEDIAAVEVYPREFTAPMRYTAAGCGSVVVWTKYAFR